MENPNYLLAEKARTPTKELIEEDRLRQYEAVRAIRARVGTVVGKYRPPQQQSQD